MLGLIISGRFIHMWQQDGVLLDLKYTKRGVLYVSTILIQVKKIVPQVEIIQCVSCFLPLVSIECHTSSGSGEAEVSVSNIKSPNFTFVLSEDEFTRISKNVFFDCELRQKLRRLTLFIYIDEL